MSQTAMKDISETSHSIKDPLSLKRHLENEKGFKKLSYWDQMDAMVAHQACAEPTTVVFFILGLITTLLNLSVLYGLVTYGQILDGVGDTDPPGYHEVLCKTTIAWFSLAAFLGLDGMYANIIVGYGAVFRSWQVGTIKEPFFCGRAGFWSFLPKWNFRRNVFDGPLLSSAYVLSRLWVSCSPVPSSAAAWAYFISTVLLLVFNYSAYIGASGMYHGPFGAFIFLKYTDTAGALSVLQLALVSLYVGCGLGKMGPWFVQVFIQEWTVPAWAKFIAIRRVSPALCFQPEDMRIHSVPQTGRPEMLMLNIKSILSTSII